MSVKANEREFMSQVTSWLNEKISNGTHPFEVASSEASIRISEKTTNFPDVQIWLNRRSGLGFCGWELKTPLTHVDDATLLEDAARKARAMSANYFITWNMRDAIIWRTPNTTEPVSREHRLETFKSIPAITKAEDLWVPSKQVLLKARARELLNALATLQRDGHLHLIDTDTQHFLFIF